MPTVTGRKGRIDVVFVSHSLEFEGAPITLFDLVAGLTAAGYVQPVVISPRPGPLGAEYEKLNIPVQLFRQPSHRDSNATFLINAMSLVRFLMKRAPSWSSQIPYRCSLL